MFLPRTVENSSLLIHPTGFYIIGFETLPFVHFYFIFLACVYIITVLANGLVISVITFNNSLHTPKFLAVGNLAVIDLTLNTCIIPSMIKLFLVKDNFVFFNVCLVQMFTYYAFLMLESFALVLLAYDRLVAICFPLRHHSLNTLWVMSCLVGLTWTYSLGITGLSTALITRLSFCRSLNVYSYFCDYAPVFRLACNDNTLHWTLSSVLSMVTMPLAFMVIVLSYACILVTVFRMKSVENRIKALATCTEHLIIVAVFYIPITTIFVIGFYLRLVDPDQRVLSLSLASCLPPCVNPILYSLKTKEIKDKLLVFGRKTRLLIYFKEKNDTPFNCNPVGQKIQINNYRHSRQTL